MTRSRITTALLCALAFATAHGQPDGEQERAEYEYLEERILAAQEGRAHSLEWVYLAEIGELEAAFDFDDPDVQRELEAIRALDWRFGHLLDQAQEALDRGDEAEAERELEHANEVGGLLQRRSQRLLRPPE